MTDRKQHDQEGKRPALYSPPSHPTTLGEVWVGVTRPSAEALSAALAKAPAELDEARNR